MRSITGTILVAVLIGGILLGRYSFGIIFFALCVLGTWEFYQLTEKNNVVPQKLYGTLLSALVFICCSLYAFDHSKFTVLLLIIPFSFFVFVLELYKKSEDPFRNIAFTLLGIVYVALPFSLLNFIVCPELSNGNYHPQHLLGYFYILWANDTGAYLVGRKFGKTKLFERVSPKKSWEGSIGGAAFALLTAYFLGMYYSDFSFFNWAVIAMIIVILGSLGDLVESLLKRSINIKDSGTILPGHGGILDRFDGLLLSAPFVFAYIIYLQ